MDQLVDALLQYRDARQQGRETEFLQQFWCSHGYTEQGSERFAKRMAVMPLPRALAELMMPFWHNYQRIIYECEACGRLWVETNTGAFAPYLPATDTRHILWSRDHHR